MLRTFPELRLSVLDVRGVLAQLERLPHGVEQIVDLTLQTGYSPLDAQANGLMS